MTSGPCFFVVWYLGWVQGIPAAASQARWAAYGKVLKIFFGTSRNMKSWLVACWEKIRNRGIAAVTACLASGPMCGW